MRWNITRVPDELHWAVRTAAFLSGETLREFVLESAKRRIDGRSEVADGGRAAGATGEGVGGSGDGAAVSVVSGSKGKKERLHKVYAVRSELDEGGGRIERPEAKPHEGHTTYKDGKRGYCSDCKEYF